LEGELESLLIESLVMGGVVHQEPVSKIVDKQWRKNVAGGIDGLMAGADHGISHFD